MTNEELKAKIKHDNPYFKDFDIKDYQIWDFISFNEEKANCKTCNGLDECKNRKKGFEPVIDSDNNVAYTRCKFMRKAESLRIRQNKLNSMYISSKSLEIKFDSFNITTEKRTKCMKYAKKFINDLRDNKHAKGAYIYGDVGAGKTYFLAALANQIVDEGHEVTFVYFPDLINDLKDDFDKLNSKIEELKKTEILIIDDFGVGNMTGWVRDSILAPILNYRMSDLRPVFISSNIAVSKDDCYDLLNYLYIKDDKDDVPASRIIRRISELCEFLELDRK